MTTLTWVGQGQKDANPNDPKNWYPAQKPTINDTAVFPWGTEQLSPSVEWAIGNLVITGGSDTILSSIPYVSGDITISGGGNLKITATTGTLLSSTFLISNGGKVVSARPVSSVYLHLTGGSELEAQNGLDVTVSVDVDNGSRGDVWGSVTIAGKSGGHNANVAPGSSFNCHGGGATCYAPDALILLETGREVFVSDLKAGDVLLNGQTINWVGRGTKPTRWVRLYKNGRTLLVTADHLILIQNVLHQASSLVGVSGLGFEKVEFADDYQGTEYWHFQTPKHGPVLASGIWTESFLDTDGRTDLVTMSGTRIERRFDRSECFAEMIVG